MHTAPDNATPKPARLEDQIRAACRLRHYSLSTEKVYVMWYRQFVRWAGLKHPATLGGDRVDAGIVVDPDLRARMPALLLNERVLDDDERRARCRPHAVVLDDGGRHQAVRRRLAAGSKTVLHLPGAGPKAGT
jgi:hypothetical protein